MMYDHAGESTVYENDQSHLGFSNVTGSFLDSPFQPPIAMHSYNSVYLGPKGARRNEHN